MTSLGITQDEDYLTGFSFALDVAGKIQGFFTEVSGIGSENAVVEQGQVGKGGMQIVRKIPGRLKWNDVTLKRGITSNFDLWKWSEDITTGGVDAQRYNGSIIMFSQDGTEVARWNFERAWLKDVKVPQFKSDGSDVLMEEVVLSHEYIVRVK